jgi:hypothetical protein
MAVHRTRWDDGRADTALRRARLGFVVAGLVLLAGAALPWAGVSAPNGRSFTVGAFETGRDGWITLACGVVVLTAGLLPPRQWLVFVAGGAGLVAVAAGFADWAQLRTVIDHARDANPSPVNGVIGFGLWLTVIGAVGAVGLAAWCTMREHAEFDRPRPRRRH